MSENKLTQEVLDRVIERLEASSSKSSKLVALRLKSEDLMKDFEEDNSRNLALQSLLGDFGAFMLGSGTACALGGALDLQRIFLWTVAGGLIGLVLRRWGQWYKS